MNKIQSEDESVSGKSYKRKLQEGLFAQSDRVVKNEHQLLQKRKRSEGQSDSEHTSPKKKKIKREPESDVDVSATKHKTNGHNHSESCDESYLDLKVEAEQLFAAPLVKTKKKKNKSKKRKDFMSDEINYQESLLEGGETAEEDSSTQYAEVQEASATTQVNTETVQDIKKKNKKCSNNDPDDSSKKDNKQTPQAKQQPNPPVNTSVSFHTLSKSVNHSPRISERIQFEEDESSERETSQLQSSKQSTKSSKLKSYLTNNINLKPLTTKLKTQPVLTADDEVWIVRCPKDVDVDAFQNKDLMLEGKSKLKLNGPTYEGVMDDESENMCILSSEQTNYITISVPVKGCLNLRKRIPKSHIRDETMFSNQTNFIPLPETKCRHPLFGSNYRKAIKLPADVAERLRAPPARAAYERANMRRTRCRAHSVQQHDPLLNSPKAEPNRESSVKPEEESDQLVISKKKKKKRKHLNSEEIGSKKNKRMKHDLESAEAWESAQAIEENLFNF